MALRAAVLRDDANALVSCWWLLVLGARCALQDGLRCWVCVWLGPWTCCVPPFCCRNLAFPCRIADSAAAALSLQGQVVTAGPRALGASPEAARQ